jgi:hypothetical protein
MVLTPFKELYLKGVSKVGKVRVFTYLATIQTTGISENPNKGFEGYI